MLRLQEPDSDLIFFSVSTWPLRLIAHKCGLRRQDLNSDLYVYVSKWPLRLISHKSC
jgi:hypothetical protein